MPRLLGLERLQISCSDDMSEQRPIHPTAAPQQAYGHSPAVGLPQMRRAGAPVRWAAVVAGSVPCESLTPAEFAARVGLSRASVYRYIGSKALPDHLVIRAGARKLIIAESAVGHFLEYWRSERGSS